MVSEIRARSKVNFLGFSMDLQSVHNVECLSFDMRALCSVARHPSSPSVSVCSFAGSIQVFLLLLV